VSSPETGESRFSTGNGPESAWPTPIWLLYRRARVRKSKSKGVREYAVRDPRLFGDDQWLLYQWCQLERGIFDAPLPRQAGDGRPDHESSLDLRWCVENSSEIALRETALVDTDLS
jgi:hypothetical protein